MNPFIYNKPTAEGIEKIEQVRSSCFALFQLINEIIPNCRERSLAITKLEEVSMWANKAIAFNVKDE